MSDAMLFQTRALFPNVPKNALYHTVEVDEAGVILRVLCDRVTVANIDDELAAMMGGENEPPTCPACIRRDPRFGKTP